MHLFVLDQIGISQPLCQDVDAERRDGNPRKAGEFQAPANRAFGGFDEVGHVQSPLDCAGASGEAVDLEARTAHGVERPGEATTDAGKVGERVGVGDDDDA